MSKCAAYWRAKESGKECGVPESRSSMAAQNKYVELIDELVGMGAVRDIAFDLLPYTIVARSSCQGVGKLLVPVVALRRDSPIRKCMVDYIFQSIASNKKVTREGLLKASGTDKSKWTDSDYMKHYSISAAKSAIGGKKIHKLSAARSMKLAAGDVTRLTSVCSVNGYTSLTARLQSLSNICTAGQLGILSHMVSNGYGDDEYAAFSIALKWAFERMEGVKENHDQLQSDP